ncbi:MAG: substrate-binding domain-containing protein [Actinomycetota bacterium]|nr:substrate-binding domain-containing protein [Actinomycetota bacterium]
MLDVLHSMLRAVQSAVVFLGAGNIVVAICTLIATPYVDRLVIRRRRLTFRVLYNSTIGIGPEILHSEDDHTHVRSEELVRFAKLLDRMSVVVIRIRNSGSHDITSEDFDRPLSFTFGRRLVWNARISEVANDTARRRIRDGLEFFSTTPQPKKPAPTSGSLRAVRDWLPTRLWSEAAAPNWQGVRFRTLELERRQRFKLVMVLVEPEGAGGAITKEIKHGGKLGEGGLRDEKDERLITLPRLTGGIAAALTAFLLIGVVFPSAPAGSEVGCETGELAVVGSSVFMPMMRTLAGEYQRSCPGATITTTATGSVDGVRRVSDLDPAAADGLVALADGKQAGAGADLRAEQLAIVVYHVAVNSSAGLDGLSTAQLQGIYDGTYRDWSQLRGGAPLPIRIVARGGESGSRELFEQKVLRTAEPGLTSNNCLSNDRDPRTPVIRCERNTNDEVVRVISQTPGTIGYSDAASIAQARKGNAVTALTIDNKAFDTNTVIESGYPFWTVEYLYARRAPGDGTLLKSFLHYVQRNDTARARLAGTGYVPCTTADRAPLELCNHR